MKFLELTKFQHDNRKQDPGVAVNAEHIIMVGVFEYNTGETVTDITLIDGKKVEVTETYSDVLDMLRKMK